jgi:hypothetical protein
VGERRTSIGETRNREEWFEGGAQAINENLGRLRAWRRVVEGEEEADVRRLIRADAQWPTRSRLLLPFWDIRSSTDLFFD